jgi:hypothetical protein
MKKYVQINYLKNSIFKNDNELKNQFRNNTDFSIHL